MTKPILKTTVKLSITHHRLAITVKYTNGQVIKTSSTYGGDRIATEQPVGSASVSAELKKIFTFVCKTLPGEINGPRFERLAKFFETTTSIQDAASKV